LNELLQAILSSSDQLFYSFED